jgi:hypothetical protein
MVKHRTFVYESGGGSQIAVEVWPDGIEVKIRPDPSAVWGLPLRKVSEEGDSLQFAFEEESLP